MKQFYLPILGLMAWAALLLSGCTNEDAGPIIDFDGGLEFGAFPELLQTESGEYDINNLQMSSYIHTVDFIDGNGGRDIETYRILVSFDGAITGEGDPLVYREISNTEFEVNDETGNLGLRLEIPFTEVAALFDIPANAIVSGDRFRFRSELIKFNGTVFNSVNSTPAVTNAFRGVWNWNVTANCLLAEDDFAGDYRLEYGFVYDEFDLFGVSVTPFGPSLDRTVTLLPAEGSKTKRTFNYGVYLGNYWFETPDVTLEFACDELLHSNIDSRVGCGDGSIQAVQREPSQIDRNNDRWFEVVFIDFAPGFDGGCGVSPREFSIIFNKVQ